MKSEDYRECRVVRFRNKNIQNIFGCGLGKSTKKRQS